MSWPIKAKGIKPYYQDKTCAIYCGDSRKVLPTLPKSSVDVVVTSPPYLNLRDYNGNFKSWSVVPEVLAKCPMKDDGQIFVNLGVLYRNGEICLYWDELFETMQLNGFRLFAWYVWDKGYGFPGDWSRMGRFAPAHEFIFQFNKKARRVNKTKECQDAGKWDHSTQRQRDGTTKDFGTKGRRISEYKVPDSVLRFPPQQSRVVAEVEHPAAFPLELPAEFINAFSSDGQVVLDPFMGSGTTLRAAQGLDRKSIGIEVERKYCDIAVERLSHKVVRLGRKSKLVMYELFPSIHLNLGAK